MYCIPVVNRNITHKLRSSTVRRVVLLISLAIARLLAGSVALSSLVYIPSSWPLCVCVYIVQAPMWICALRTHSFVRHFTRKATYRTAAWRDFHSVDARAATSYSARPHTDFERCNVTVYIKSNARAYPNRKETNTHTHENLSSSWSLRHSCECRAIFFLLNFYLCVAFVCWPSSIVDYAP